MSAVHAICYKMQWMNIFEL